MSLQEFLKQDEQQLEELIQKYPNNIPVKEVSRFLGMNDESLRAVLDHKSNPFGLSWLKGRSLNRAFHIPTAIFVRWYMKMGD